MNTNNFDEVYNAKETVLLRSKDQAWIKIFKAIGIIFCIIVVVIGLGIYGIFRLIGSGCGNEIISEVPQLGGAYKAIVFIRDCGATTRESYQVSIIKRGSKIKKSDTGNVFITYDPVNISWWQNKLIINYGGGQVFKQKKNYKEIEINYK